MMDFFSIFQYEFMVRAFTAGLIIAVVAPTIGIFLVVKRYALLADTLSHVALLGVAFGVLFNINPVVGALILSAAAALGIEWLRGEKGIFGEAVLSLFLSGSLAIALVILGLSEGINVNLFSLLFGSITTVSMNDLTIVGLGGLLVILFVGVLFKRLFLVSYDEDLAEASGLPTKVLNFILIFLAAITIAISMRIVGVLLIGALMVIPVLTASQFRLGFTKTALASIAISLISVIVGIFASFYADLPSGATVVVIALILFGMSILFNRKYS